MFAMELQNVVRAFVEAMLPRFSGANRALVMTFELSVSKGDRRVIKQITHLLFHRPRNHTKVCWVICEDVREFKNHNYANFHSWEIKSDDDSCWVEDGVESEFHSITRQMMSANDPHARRDQFELECDFHALTHPTLVELTSFSVSQDERIFTVEFGVPINPPTTNTTATV